MYSGSVDDPEVLGPRDLDAGLDQTASSAHDGVNRLHNHALAAAACQGLPPADCLSHTRGVAEIDDTMVGGDDHRFVRLRQPSGNVHVPLVVIAGVEVPFHGEHDEYSKA